MARASTSVARCRHLCSEKTPCCCWWCMQRRTGGLRATQRWVGGWGGTLPAGALALQASSCVPADVQSCTCTHGDSFCSGVLAGSALKTPVRCAGTCRGEADVAPWGLSSGHQHPAHHSFRQPTLRAAAVGSQGKTDCVCPGCNSSYCTGYQGSKAFDRRAPCPAAAAGGR